MLASFFARLIRLVNINRVTTFTDDGSIYVQKRRHPLSTLLIIPGNWVFSFRRVPVRVLSISNWLDWETTVAKALGRPSPKSSDKVLLMPHFAGVNLSEHWTTNQTSLVDRLDHATLAVESLRQFHLCSIVFDSRCEIPVSHGDATVQNVMFEENPPSATWFDFDLQHDLRVDAVTRHADDLRALLFSAAHFFSMDEIDTLVQTARATYPIPEVWDALSEQITSRWFLLDLFHLAHTQRFPLPNRFRRTSQQRAERHQLLIDVITGNRKSN